MQYKKKSNAIGTIAIVLVLVLLVGGLGFLSKGFKDWNVKDWFNKVDPVPGGSVVDGDGNEMKPGQVYEMPSKMVFTSATGTALTDGITVSAVIEPIDAHNKAVDWAVSFVNPSSSWATGKTVNTYVTATPATDGALTANIKCVEGFSEQIKITVTSRDNPAAKADCLLDYTKRISNVDLQLIHNNDSNKHAFCSDNEDIAIPFSNSSFVADYQLDLDYNYSSVGTTTDKFVKTSIFGLNPAYGLELMTKGLILLTTDYYIDTDSFIFDLKEFTKFFKNPLTNKEYNEAVRIGQTFAQKQTPLFYYSITLTGAYSTYTTKYGIYWTVDSMHVGVENITLDDSTIVF